MIRYGPGLSGRRAGLNFVQLASCSLLVYALIRPIKPRSLNTPDAPYNFYLSYLPPSFISPNSPIASFSNVIDLRSQVQSQHYPFPSFFHTTGLNIHSPLLSLSLSGLNTHSPLFSSPLPPSLRSQVHSRHYPSSP